MVDGSGNFTRKSRTALRHPGRQTPIGSKQVDFQIVFAKAASDAPRVIVGNMEEDIVTASKFTS